MKMCCSVTTNKSQLPILLVAEHSFGALKYRKSENSRTKESIYKTNQQSSLQHYIDSPVHKARKFSAVLGAKS